jgi:hypothetical protein
MNKTDAPHCSLLLSTLRLPMSQRLLLFDPFMIRGVGFVKLNTHCTLVEGEIQHEQRLKGICFLKGDSVATLIALHDEEGNVFSLLVEQPR